jgi:uncharacterized membrane protein
MLHAIFLFLHLAAAIVWIGGMFFAYFCLRPAAAQVLDPSQRLTLWTATFERFLRYAAIAVVVLIGSGFALLLPIGLHAAPHGWIAMIVLGFIMSGVFVYIYAVLYPEMVRNTQASSWPAAAARLNAIRRMVAVNLVLATALIASVVAAR